jgi:Family of unknown function (DUF6165)
LKPVLVGVSVGELLDKIVILELKAARIAGERALRNVQNELRLLQQSLAELDLDLAALAPLIDGLRRVNAELWRIEDEIRDCEEQQRFDETFIALARSVYLTNDERARLKRSINDASGSALSEEKLYKEYTRTSLADGVQ